jgi:hypothetical protein
MGNSADLANALARQGKIRLHGHRTFTEAFDSPESFFSGQSMHGGLRAFWEG